ncbi:hypothetical protein [Thalassomonas haliotis]|uniref:Lipoprotein n=1 Tax=Thalassomonas haliotis TaxID=485448 RepID=A0ABY7V9P9_9GAMM|nr:hypothetical protein [Thalassomonas haliotis]WDE10303.1 hypothetical protein H3N35_18760 [Thalassomonas haliotis]
MPACSNAKVAAILLFVLSGFLAACKSTSPLKSAQVYCMEIERDTYSECLSHRRAYLDAREKIMTRFREQKKNCEAYAIRKSGGGNNSCVSRDNMVKAGSGSSSVTGGVDHSTDCSGDLTGRSASDVRINALRYGSKSDIEKKCMLDMGWQSHHSFRPELKAVAQKYGYAKEENDG